MKQGFTLLEVVLAVALAAYASTIMFVNFDQINRAVRSAEMSMDDMSRLALASHQMTRDMVGAWEPARALQARQKKQKDKEKREREEALKKQQQGPDECALGPAAPDLEAKDDLTAIFNGTTRDGHLDMVTFITHNPLPVYVGKRSKKSTPHLVRVVYRLVPEEKGKGKPSFKLMRQEDENLDVKAFEGNAIRAYEVIRGIKDLKITYVSQKRVKQEQEKGKPPSYTISYANHSEWDMANDPDQMPIPYALNVELIVWDTNKKRERKMQFPIVIAPNYAVNQYDEKKQSTGTPADQGQAAQQQSGAQAPGAAAGPQQSGAPVPGGGASNQPAGTASQPQPAGLAPAASATAQPPGGG